MWWDGTVKVMRIGAAIWVAAVTVLSVMQKVGWVPQAPNLEPYAWVISLIIIGVDSAGGLVANRARSKKREKTLKIQKALMSLLIQLDKTKGLRFAELGASVYVPSFWDRVRRLPPERVRLKRMIRFRPAGYPQQSGVNWSGSKGVVGQCWRNGAATYMNWSATAADWSGEEITPEKFEGLPEDKRVGFTLREFQAIAGKYSEIAAEPLWHGTKDRVLIGVLSVDRAYQPDGDPFLPRLNRVETQAVIAATAATIGGIVKPEVEPA